MNEETQITTRKLIEELHTLKPETRDILLKAVATKGRYKDYLLASSPSWRENPEGCVAWNVMVSNLSPNRMNIGSVMAAGASAKFSDLSGKVDKAGLDRLIKPVEPAFRWNMYANNHNVEEERKQILHWLSLDRGESTIERY